MDLHELHERTGIDPRRLRYCLDHDLIPGLQIDLAPREAGRPRKFADDVGFGIVCAAKLLELGVSHAVIRRFLQGILDIVVTVAGRRHPALCGVLEHRYPAIAYLGDGEYVRLVGSAPPWDSRWTRPGKRAKSAEEYVPQVQITLDLGRIRDLVYGAGQKM